MQTDNLNIYILASLIIHAFFLLTLSSSYIQRDISQIGEQKNANPNGFVK